MTILGSGEISLGVNATTTRSVACELTCSGTGSINMNQAAVRDLASRFGNNSEICMCNFYSKTRFATAVGSSFGGGFLAGVTCDCSCNVFYRLVIAPNASGCDCCVWRCVQGQPAGADFTNDGFRNTRSFLCTSNEKAGNWAATRSINGFSDWYLPSNSEGSTVFNMRGSLPAGEGFAGDPYWLSQGGPSQQAFELAFDRGSVGTGYQLSAKRVRAVRRTPV